MSIDWMNRVFKLGPEVSGSDRMVLMIIANYTDDEHNEAYPGLKRIASMAGITRRDTVRKTLRRLEDRGFISTDVGMGRVKEVGKGQQPSLYTLYPEVFDIHTPPAEDSTPPTSRVRPPTGNGVQTQVVTQGDPKREPKGKSKGSRISPEWKPEPVSAVLAFGLDLEFQEATFRDHWLSAPGQRGVKLDWQATWRNWLRNAQKYAQVVVPAELSGTPRPASQPAKKSECLGCEGGFVATGNRSVERCGICGGRGWTRDET